MFDVTEKNDEKKHGVLSLRFVLQRTNLLIGNQQ